MSEDSLRPIKQAIFLSQDAGLNPAPRTISLELVTPERRHFFDDIIKTHHGYVPTTNYGGRQINFFVKGNGRILGTIGLGSAIMAMKDRDKFIGWSKEARLKNLTHIANNWRFTLIDKTPNLASQVLSLLTREGQKEWLKKYGDRLVLLETLVKPPYTGKCYEAAGWQKVGKTAGTLFKWIKKVELENVRAQFKPLKVQVSSKFIKYGDNINPNVIQVAINGGVPSKIIYVKPIYRFWKNVLRSIYIAPQSKWGMGWSRWLGET